MTGEKYSHLDESQIGEIYVNEDNKDVLQKGISYYSIMEGSMGTTLRGFEPIFYNNKQVGFIMVGKYEKDITVINSKTKTTYTLLFLFSIILSNSTEDISEFIFKISFALSLNLFIEQYVSKHPIFPQLHLIPFLFITI